jgi:hypothetical protein
MSATALTVARAASNSSSVGPAMVGADEELLVVLDSFMRV